MPSLSHSHGLALRVGAALALVVLVGVLLLGPGGLFSDKEERKPRPGLVRNPIDPRQQTAVAFGERSHWHQPWRAYLDTPPATRLLDAIGINFNVSPEEAEATARLLAESGFRRARVEFGWDQIDFSNPRRLASPGRFRAILGALDRYGIRPLILLNAHHGKPGPTRLFEAELVSPAPQGAREVRLSPATAAEVEPGRTGLNASDGKAAEVLFTDVRPDGTASLSRPLRRPLPAGPHPAATLRYEPFGPPQLEDGSPNPRFEATLRGWLDYVQVVAREARAVVGDEQFDVEVWNELSFGSDFLFQERYYEPARERGRGDVTREILERTVRALRDPASGVSGIGIGDGFANQTPFPAGSTSPVGLTAIDKHPYYPVTRFPEDAVQNEIAPLDALGRRDFEEERLPGGEIERKDRFLPSYTAFFPEYTLTAARTEHLIRDLSPITTDVNGTPHGRRTAPPGGSPPQVWITETNLDPTGADPSAPGAGGDDLDGGLAPRQVEHLHAKAALRYYTAFVNKGVSAVHLYAVKGGRFALIRGSFFERLSRTAAYPGDGTGGETPRVVRRLTLALRGAESLTRARPLSLRSIADDRGHAQFEGDGTRAHPPLFDREVVAFFPFQLSEREWVAAAYVMTRNLARVYDEDASESDPRRYDMPPEKFRIAIGGIRGAGVTATASDPLTGERVPVEVSRHRRGGVVVELPLTDSPRLLRLRER
jgi:hypothetical protein